jgi:hypothetical protein
MAQIVIEVDPAQLDDPDLDIRYDLPELIEAASAGNVDSDGYDFDEDDRLHVYLTADDLVAALRVIGQVLSSSLVGGNDLSRCRVGVREGAGVAYDVVLPEGSGGRIAALQE